MSEFEEVLKANERDVKLQMQGTLVLKTFPDNIISPSSKWKAYVAQSHFCQKKELKGKGQSTHCNNSMWICLMMVISMIDHCDNH